MEDETEETIESDWSSEPECPKCGASYGDPWEHRDLRGDGDSIEIECGDCKAKLTLALSVDWEYQLSYTPPTQEEKEKAFEEACKSVRFGLARRREWEAQAPERARVKADKEARRLACAETWLEHEWPSWVPAKIRSIIEEFWREDHGRDPFSWMESARNNDAPEMGTVVTMDADSCVETSGRYVHTWNNIGRVVDDAGKAHFCSVGGSGKVVGQSRGNRPLEIPLSTSLGVRLELERGQ